MTQNTTHQQHITHQADFAPLPVLEGFRFYHFSGSDSDYGNIAKIVNSRQGEPDFYAPTTAEEAKHDYQFLGDSCDLTRDLIFAEKDGEAVAYTRSSQAKDETEDIWQYHTRLFIRPDLWDCGLPETFLAWSEAQAVLCHKAFHRDCAGEHRLFSKQKMSKKVELAKNAGYQPIRYWDTLVHDLENIPHHPLPEVFELRPVMPSNYRKVWEADNEAFLDHWGMTEHTEDDFQAYIKAPEFQPYLFQVAWDGEEIAGCVQCWISGGENESKHRERAWISDIAVRRPWRGNGLAKALTSRTLQVFKLLNLKEVALVVDTKNPSGAYELYEKLGFRFDEREITWMKPLIV